VSQIIGRLKRAIEMEEMVDEAHNVRVEQDDI
jgi:hypothetical protein